MRKQKQKNTGTHNRQHKRCRKGNHLIILNFQLRCLQLPQTAAVAWGGVKNWLYKQYLISV